MEHLNYKSGDQFSAIPTFEQGLQTVVANYFFQVYNSESYTLEGLCFDRNGDLYFVSTAGNTVFKLDMKTMNLSVIYHEENLRTVAVKIHKDGRLFICCLENKKVGGIIAMNPDGSNPEVIIRGYSVDDMVFDSKGGFYFTHYVGDFRDPSGAVFHVSSDFQTITPFVRGLCKPNGIALSVDETVLWVTEFGAGRLHRFSLDSGRSSIPYRFTGYAGPDSCCIDKDDNLYVAIPPQGRVMVFNSFGSPIGQVLTPGREKGHNLFTTHPMVRPDTRELYIACKDDSEKSNEGSWIFRAGSYAEGNNKAYQLT